MSAMIFGFSPKYDYYSVSKSIGMKTDSMIYGLGAELWWPQVTK